MSIRADLKGDPNFHAISQEELPWTDFTKTVAAPGVLEEWPNGGVGIYVDDNFWCMASLPYAYKDWTIQALVADLWPDAKDPTFNEDEVENPLTDLEKHLHSLHEKKLE